MNCPELSRESRFVLVGWVSPYTISMYEELEGSLNPKPSGL